MKRFRRGTIHDIEPNPISDHAMEHSQNFDKFRLKLYTQYRYLLKLTNSEIDHI